MFDLYYFSFNVTDQLHQPDLPGILVSPPLKKGSHRRDGDLVILFLSLNGHNPYTPEELTAMQQRAAQVYYKSSGSLTAGMRAAADVCNNQLIERNLKNARDEGGQAIARMNIGVLREDVLFLAVAGPSHALLLGETEVQDFYDPQSGRGLGTGTSTNLRYFQAQVKPGDVLVFSPDPPEVWDPSNLAGSAGLTLEHLRRRLLNGTGPNLQAVVLKFQTGSGEVHALRHRSTTPQTAAPMARPPTSETDNPDAPASYLSEAPVQPSPENKPAVIPQSPVPAAPPTRPSAPPEGGRAHQGGRVPSRPAPLPSVNESSPMPPPRSGRRRRDSVATPPIPAALEPETEDRQVSQAAALEAARLARQRRLERKQKAATVWNGWKSFTARTGQAWRSLWVRLAPQRTSAPGLPGTAPRIRVSPALLVFIAIAVPLMVVAVAMTVYLQTGRGEQRSEAFQQAALYAGQATTEKDPVLQRNAWNQVLLWLDKTEQYGITADSHTLRLRAQKGVDAGDSVVRLDFQPVNHVGFAQSVHITRMVTNNNDLYLLDSSNGSVMRLFQTAQGYQLDTLFNCGPGPSGSIYIGPLIDIAAMPPVNSYNATLAAIDGNGNLMYCIPGTNAVSRSLAPPNVGWGTIRAMTLSQDSLYLLDVLGNAVWQYSANDLSFSDRPHLYSETFNLTLADVVDMAFYEDNIYFLRSDGHLVQCAISNISDIPTRCADPAVFNDPRSGRDHKPNLMPDTLFSQILTINAPDPSLFMLDPTHASIYRFSVVLNFQDQIRPSSTTNPALPRSEPTAFTITPRRIAFLAYDNQVYMAQMP